MRKSVFTRIVCFLFIYIAVFILLVIMQFSFKGNFSLKFDGMTIRGRYLISDESSEKADGLTSLQALDGNAAVFFGGLEFSLMLPEYITVLDNGAVITLSEGTELSFIHKNNHGINEMQISANLKEDVSAITIPFALQRSSLIREEKNVLNISYNGTRYQFSRQLPGIDDGQLVLNASVPSVSYRAVPDKNKNTPADFILSQAENSLVFNEAFTQWVDNSFSAWERNLQIDADEDMVIAWCAQALSQGSYRNAVSVIPLSFSTAPGRTWESGVYQFDRRIGVWERAVRGIIVHDREMLFGITQMLEEKNTGVFNEKNLIEFLFTRGYMQLIDECINLAQSIDESSLTPEISAGILEAYFDTGKLLEHETNPFETLAEQAANFLLENIQMFGEYVFFVSDGKADIMLNVRLGASLKNWGEMSGNDDWAALGRSMILSVIGLCDENSAAPSIFILGEGNAAADRINSAKFYRVFAGNEFLPRAAATGINGIWAWTVSPSLVISQAERHMDIEVKFPVGETHYILLRNVRPFYSIQIHGSDWRRAADFENYYDSSGWFYYENDQSLVIKLRHRT